MVRFETATSIFVSNALLPNYADTFTIGNYVSRRSHVNEMN